MARAHCQQVLDRIMTYLRNCDIPPDHAASRRALQLVDSVFAEWENESPGNSEPAIEWLIRRMMDRLPEFFDLPEATAPLQSPPLSRSSIGYSPYV